MRNLIKQILRESNYEYNKYKVGDQLLAKHDLSFTGTGSRGRFITGGKVYSIVKVEEDYNWSEYGYIGNRYVIYTDTDKNVTTANHGFSDVYIDRNFTLANIDTDSFFDQLNESINKSGWRVGDRVRLSSESQWFGDGGANPESEDEVGTIIHIYQDNDDDAHNSLPVEVEWDMGYENSYHHSDLLPPFDYEESEKWFE